MNDILLDVVGIIEEEIRTCLKACHMKGYTLVTIKHGIILTIGPNKRKAIISWIDGGCRWSLELIPEYTGFSREPVTRGWIQLFDINTVDIERVIDLMVTWMCGYDVVVGEL